MSELINLLRSFGHALKGIGQAVVTQRNLRIHLVALVVVILFGKMAKLSTGHWCVVLLCCMAVISLELLNTSLESLCDRLTTEPDPKIKTAKDAAAGAVLVCAMGSVAIAILLLLGDNHYSDNICGALRQDLWLRIALPIAALAGIVFVFLPARLQKPKRK